MPSGWLDSSPPRCGRDAAAVAAAVASVVGELHDRGLVHGALAPDRVMLDEAGAVSLVPADGPVASPMQPADDLAALGALFLWLAERVPDRPGRLRAGLLRVPDGAALLRDVGRRCQVADPADRPSARLVADTLQRRLSATGPLLPALPTRGVLVRRRRVTVGSVVALGLIGGAVAPAHCTPSSAVAGGSESVTWADGVLTIGARRYAVGAADDHVVVERWSCRPPSVALLRRRAGEVVAFDRFPDHGEPTIGRVLARVPGARRLVTHRTPEGCAALAVAVADGRTVPVPWEEVS